MKTKNSLTIFWYADGAHNEVDGLFFYGLWDNTLPDKLLTNQIEFKTGEIELTESKIDSETYKVYRIGIHIKKFPETKFWLSDIKSVLSWFIFNGAKIAWCGTETCSPDPQILNPGNSIGDIYACYSGQSDFICNSDLEEEMKFLDDDQLQNIKK